MNRSTILTKYLMNTPWDARALGIDTYEIQSVPEREFEHVLHEVSTMSGHFTVRVNPLSSKAVLHEHGFYYCDTLIEPYCTAERLINHDNESVSISREIALEQLIKISNNSFLFGRFHRDFGVDSKLADKRYGLWLQDLLDAGSVFSLRHQGVLAGFFGFDKNRILLHALCEAYRGRGLAKCFWSAACKEMFNNGHDEIVSSISAANTVILNVYAALGFRFRNPVDIYHKKNDGSRG